MSRLRRRGGDLDDFDAYQNETDIDFLETAGEDRRGGRLERATKHKAAWQRVDERSDIRRLREQLEDWEDWGANWPDESPPLEVPGAH